MKIPVRGKRIYSLLALEEGSMPPNGGQYYNYSKIVTNFINQ